MADQKKKSFIPADNPIEQFKDLGHGVVSDVAEVPAAILDTALEQIGLKPRKAPLSGEINLKTGEQKEVKLEAKLRQLQTVNRQEQELFNLKKRSTEEQIKKLMDQLSLEVKKLEVQTAELTADVRKITVESVPENPGAYHLNFFDWVIATLRGLGKKVTQSREWLTLWTTKKKQKGYWAMTKKHGQKFQFSDERSVATAAG